MFKVEYEKHLQPLGIYGRAKVAICSKSLHPKFLAMSNFINSKYSLYNHFVCEMICTIITMHLKLVFDVYVHVDPDAVPRKHVTATPAWWPLTS